MIDYRKLLGFASVRDAAEAVDFQNAAIGAKVGDEEESAPMDYQRLLGFSSASSGAPVEFRDATTGAKVGEEEPTAPMGRDVQKMPVGCERLPET